VDFFDAMSCLQVVDLYSLTALEKIAGSLNLYHAKILHGWLIIGVPTWKNRLKFFNTVTFIVGFEMLTIAEIENGNNR
jgi:hypothetical protein